MKPEHENGDIKGYRIYFMHGNYTDVRTTSSPVMAYTLENLSKCLECLAFSKMNKKYLLMLKIFAGPFTEYKIWVKAYTWKNEGLQSDSVRYRTDVGGPSPPAITNLTCQSNNTLYVEWKRPRPADYYTSVDHYFVVYRSTESSEFEEKSINSSESLDNITGSVSTCEKPGQKQKKPRS